MMYPVLIQVISCTVAPRVPIMCGRATATIDESMAPMSVPKVIDTVTSHLFGLGRAIARRGRAMACVMPSNLPCLRASRQSRPCGGAWAGRARRLLHHLSEELPARGPEHDHVGEGEP